MLDKIEQIEKDALAEIARASDLRALEESKAKFLGRQDGLITAILRNVGELPKEQRKATGERANKAKTAMEAALAEAEARLGSAAQAVTLAASAVDVTLPGRRAPRGTRHPLTQVADEIVAIFARMGFGVERGPEVETDWHNFEALNFPPEHPARDMQDTFFVDGDVAHPKDGARRSPMVLRTHTSPVQIRAMLSRRPPIRVVIPGAVYRHDSDQTHSPMFHQVEGLMVDEGISFADLKGVLLEFARAMFGAKTAIRLRPSFFPFTEPSAEVDVSCFACTEATRASCRVCKATGWIEILGSGMVHPNVFASVGWDPEKVQGFAFGMGVERVAMLKHRIPDIRLFFENDLRFLKQFGGGER